MLRLTSLCLLLLIGCNRSSTSTPVPAPSPAPASAPEKPKVESELPRTTLPAKSAKSLGIATTQARVRPVQDTLRLTGVIVPPAGYESTITAPLAGVVKLPPGGSFPIPGRPIVEGQVLFMLEPVLGPAESVQILILKQTVENEKSKAIESETIAKKEYDRQVDLRKVNVSNQQNLDQAHVKWIHAQEDLKTANAKLELFTDHPREIRAPRSGTLMTILVTPGQTVAAAAPLASVIDLSKLWLRVSVPESDLNRINRQQSISVELKPTGASGTSLSKHLVQADFVAIVPQVDPIKHTADLFYELAPAPIDRLLLQEFTSLDPVRWCGARPNVMAPFFARDQMFPVAVPLDEKKNECVVPVSAVLYDAYGGTWIYVEQSSSDKTTFTYERRRVELGAVLSDGVVVRPPCKDGERVVSVGAGALFSREFFKVPIKVEGDE
jgi:multidrug efflux pump subunit AcrA (membrane-fusion protein)